MWSRMFVRRLTTAASGQGGVVPSSARYKKVQELQNAFSRDDGLLVWQKMGSKDNLFYYATVILMIGGFIPSIGTILKMSFPKKE